MKLIKLLAVFTVLSYAQAPVVHAQDSKGASPMVAVKAEGAKTADAKTDAKTADAKKEMNCDCCDGKKCKMKHKSSCKQCKKDKLIAAEKEMDKEHDGKDHSEHHMKHDDAEKEKK